MGKKNRNVAIVGIGQTEYSSHKEYQNQPEMINEAVRAALKDANLTLDDIDCVVHGNMELFECVPSLIYGMYLAPAPLANRNSGSPPEGRPAPPLSVQLIIWWLRACMM